MRIDLSCSISIVSFTARQGCPRKLRHVADTTVRQPDLQARDPVPRMSTAQKALVEVNCVVAEGRRRNGFDRLPCESFKRSGEESVAGRQSGS
jgi:hypothetical protein